MSVSTASKLFVFWTVLNFKADVKSLQVKTFYHNLTLSPLHCGIILVCLCFYRDCIKCYVINHLLLPITECFHLTKTYISLSDVVFSKGADMDVCLTNYGHCNFLSGKHACIFYDEVCPHIEQLPNGYFECSPWSDVIVFFCLALFRTPSITSCLTTVSTVQQLTMFSTPVTFLRKLHRLHLVAWLPKSRALSVSPKSYILCPCGESDW